MRYEFSIALKYLLPRVKQISVSIISLLSILVISLVVWLILVFLSVTDGLEKGWIEKLVTINAPLRITPTPAYYNSYYYQIDSVSQASDFHAKNIGEKRTAEDTDPYDLQLDQELPFPWPVPDRNPDGTLKDIVKLAFESIQSLSSFSGMKAYDFEIALTQLKLHSSREAPIDKARGSTKNLSLDNALTYVSYVTSFPGESPKLAKILQEPTADDLHNLLNRLFESEEPSASEKQTVISQRLQNFFQHTSISRLKSPPNGWNIPRTIIPNHAQFQVCTLEIGNKINQVIIPSEANQQDRLFKELQEEGFQASKGILKIADNRILLQTPQMKPTELPSHIPLILEADVQLDAQLVPESIKNAAELKDLHFLVNQPIQKNALFGEVPYQGLVIAKALTNRTFSAAPARAPYWTYQVDKTSILPNDPDLGYGVLLAKNFRSNGILLGDKGQVSYLAGTAGSMQEQNIPIYVAGFYDPGIIPLGGKLIMADQETTNLIRSSISSIDQGMTNGIQVWFDQVDQAEKVKEELNKAFAARGIASYWKIESFKDYEFSKDLLNQLKSDKNLFTLIAVIIILVACSNIISMLILLVNDKKREVGILQSMGASSRSIALIFGICGVVMGVLSSLIGTTAAYFTLLNLHHLVDFISSLQGYDAFNTVFYGDSLPNQMSSGALTMVWIATTCISLLAGLVPAIKASLLKPTAILRSE